MTDQPSLPKRNRWPRRIGLVLAVALGTLLVIELALRLAYPILPTSAQIALRFVRITPLTNARLAPLPLWQSDRDYQFIAAPDVKDSLQIGSQNVQFRVSTYNWWGGRVGFRTPPPTDGQVQAVALGDSHTFCFVEDRFCWVNLLSADTGLPIANFGQPATGSVSHARLYYDFVAKPDLNLGQPRLVLWQFYGNDFNDDFGLAVLNGTNQNPPAEGDQGEASNTSPGGWLAEQSALVALLNRNTNDPRYAVFVDPYTAQYAGNLIQFGRPYLTASFDMNQPRNLEGEALSQQAMLETRDRVEAAGGRFFVLLMPTKEEVYSMVTAPALGYPALDTLAAPRLRMADFCNAQHIACLDLTSYLQEEAARGTALFFADDIHLTPAGNLYVSRLVAELLRGQGII